MKKSLLVLVALTVVCAALAQAAEPTIIGAPKCVMCHKVKTGDQAKIWTESAHAGAFATLKGPAAIAIAKEKGLGNPWEEAACLKCHTTKGFLGAALEAATKWVPEEGVGCEACHGAGSGYKSKAVMEDHAAAVAAGMKMGGKETCVKCHNAQSPTFKAFDYDKMWALIKHPVPAAAAK
ncbi:MAG: cytochrome C554 [bacterium]|nr:cytochrome C554 [bacterium]